MSNQKSKKMSDNTVRLTVSGIMVAMSTVLSFIKFSELPYGGSVTLFSFVPIIFGGYAYGTKWGLSAGFVYSCVQMLLGFYVPPANTFISIVLCVLLDYVLAFTALGLASVFATPFEKSGKPALRLAGYIVGAIGASALRFVCSFLSGVILWDSYAPEGMNVWVYSLVYNGSYMLGNAAIAAVILFLLCAAVDPKTLKPMGRK